MTITSEVQIGKGVVTWPSRYRHYLPVTLQTLEDDYCSYCVRFAGNGKYFKTLGEAAEYVKQRFNIVLREETQNHEEVYYCSAGKGNERRVACG